MVKKIRWERNHSVVAKILWFDSASKFPQFQISEEGALASSSRWHFPQTVKIVNDNIYNHWKKTSKYKIQQRQEYQ